MRRYSILGLLALVNFATVGLGEYLDGENGKLAISNFSPVLFLVFALPSFLMIGKAVDRALVGFLLLFNALAWVSFAIFAARYGWKPNWLVLYFQVTEIVFVAMLIWYARRHQAEFISAAHWGTIVAAGIAAWSGYSQLRSGPGAAGALILTFGMDDKSQAAVLFCCQAFILVRYFGRPLDHLVAGLLTICSFLTLSRLPVAFLPVLLLAVARRSKWGAALAVLASVGVVVAFVLVGDVMSAIFKVVDRISSVDAVAGDDATSAHLLLLEHALKMKFTDVPTFLFGAGPGNFSKALISFPIPHTELDSIDPALISEAHLGRAPMHSTPVSLLLDYNIVIFCILGYLLMRGFRALFRLQAFVEVIFFATLFAASMFYSLHNKPYLFLMVATIALLTEFRGAWRHATAGKSSGERTPGLVAVT